MIFGCGLYFSDKSDEIEVPRLMGFLPVDLLRLSWKMKETQLIFKGPLNQIHVRYSRVSSLKFLDDRYSLVIKHDLLDNRQFRIDANVGDFLAARHVDSGWIFSHLRWLGRHGWIVAPWNRENDLQMVVLPHRRVSLPYDFSNKPGKR